MKYSWRDSVGPFIVALAIAAAIVNVAWLHSPPLGYERGASQSGPNQTKNQHAPGGSAVTNSIADEKHGHGKKDQDWYSKIIDHLPDWFVAIFTGLLVYVTYRLVRATSDLRSSTDKLWEAGERQINVAERSAQAAMQAAAAATLSANAAVRIELPLIRAISDDLAHIDHPIDERAGGYTSSGLSDIPGTYSVWPAIELRNNGRTNAFPKEAKLGWAVTGDLPMSPKYTKTIKFQPGDILKGTEFRLYPDITITLDAAQRARLINKTARLWTYLRLTYDDFMGDPHEVNFCWYWGCPNTEFHYFMVPIDDVPEEYKRKT